MYMCLKRGDRWDWYFSPDGAFIGDCGGLAKGCSVPLLGTVVDWMGTGDFVG
jgi:hypothetical protein